LNRREQSKGRRKRGKNNEKFVLVLVLVIECGSNIRKEFRQDEQD